MRISHWIALRESQITFQLNLYTGIKPPYMSSGERQASFRKRIKLG